MWSILAVLKPASSYVTSAEFLKTKLSRFWIIFLLDHPCFLNFICSVFDPKIAEHISERRDLRDRVFSVVVKIIIKFAVDK